jgi:hypothetical protein
VTGAQFDPWCDLVHVLRLAVPVMLDKLQLRLETIMNKLIAFAAIAFLLSAGAVITIMINAQPVMAGICDNPTTSC